MGFCLFLILYPTILLEIATTVLDLKLMYVLYCTVCIYLCRRRFRHVFGVSSIILDCRTVSRFSCIHSCSFLCMHACMFVMIHSMA